MKREIKFRVWDTVEKRWWKEFSMDLVQGISKMSEKSCYKIQQYTGLKDRKGKDIYEGDIVQTNWSENDDLICKVVYWKNGFYFEYKNNSLIGDTIYQFQYCEIIGNIFENTDLLKL